MISQGQEQSHEELSRCRITWKGRNKQRRLQWRRQGERGLHQRNSNMDKQASCDLQAGDDGFA